MLDVNFGTRFFIDISIFLFFYFFFWLLYFVLVGFFLGVGGVGLGVFVCFVCVCFVCVFFLLLCFLFFFFLLNIRFLGGLPVRVDNSFLRRYKISICFGFFLILYLIVCFRFFYFIFFFYIICDLFWIYLWQTENQLSTAWIPRAIPHVKEYSREFQSEKYINVIYTELNLMVKVKDPILWCRSLYFFHQIFA